MSCFRENINSEICLLIGEEINIKRSWVHGINKFHFTLSQNISTNLKRTSEIKKLYELLVQTYNNKSNGSIISTLKIIDSPYQDIIAVMTIEFIDDKGISLAGQDKLNNLLNPYPELKGLLIGDKLKKYKLTSVKVTTSECPIILRRLDSVNPCEFPVEPFYITKLVNTKLTKMLTLRKLKGN